ncbi:MAG: FAD:protein FMN transferase [Candidatus Pacebacteria bacterium]|nr:FAD:protein FMN transferase [Candidatus Paceibacterota bacterium]
MKETKLIMGMPVTVEIVDPQTGEDSLALVFDYFKYVDEKFSTYKSTSEITLINEGKIEEKNYSDDMREIFALAEKTKKETDSYFDIKNRENVYDPSGIVKGWAIHNAGKILKDNGYKNFCIEAGGDIETFGLNDEGKPWTIGIRNPFQTEEIVKVLEITDKGIATSGTHIRGQHIYNPKNKAEVLNDVASLTVIGPDIYEADRFATACFAMGKDGIMFLENLPGFEGYMIDNTGMATMTNGFNQYQKNN